MRAIRNRCRRQLSLLVLALLAVLLMPAAIFAADDTTMKYSETITIVGTESYGMVRVDETNDPLTLSYVLDDDQCFADNVTWSSSDETVATIAPLSDNTNRAVVTPHKAGKTIITVTQTQPEDKTISGEVEITVRNKGIFSIDIDLYDDYFIEGNYYGGRVYVQEDEWSGDKVIWESSDESLMTISHGDDGRYASFYAVAPGNVTITARAASNPDIIFDSVDISISDKNDIRGFSCSARDTEIAEDGKSLVKPRIYVENYKDDIELEESTGYEIVEYLDADKNPLAGNELQEGDYYVRIKGIAPYHGETTIGFYAYVRNSLNNEDRFDYYCNDLNIMNGVPDDETLDYSISDNTSDEYLVKGTDYEEAGFYERTYDENGDSVEVYYGDQLPTRGGRFYLLIKGINDFNGEMKVRFDANERRDCGEIKAGVPAAIDIYEDSYYYFKFVPENTARYTFYSVSSGGADPHLKLYINEADDEDNEVLDTDDIGAGNLDFRGDANLIKGQVYYLRIYAYDSGKVTVNIVDNKAADDKAAADAAAKKAAADAAAKKAAAEKAAAAQKLQAYNSAKAAAQVGKVTKPKTKAKAKKKAQVTWKKAAGASGYEIQYSLKKNFKKAKTVTVKGGSKKKATLKKLKAGKKYYVRIRPYTNVTNTSGATEKVYGKWSKTMKIKAKK